MTKTYSALRQSSAIVADPFGAGPRRIVLPEGLTIKEMVNHAVANDNLPAWAIERARVYIGGEEIYPNRWTRVRPKPGAHIAIVTTPQGGGRGGSKILQTVAMIAVVALTAWTGAGGIAAALSLGGGSTFAAGGMGAMLAAMGVSMVGVIGRRQHHEPCRPRDDD